MACHSKINKSITSKMSYAKIKYSLLFFHSFLVCLTTFYILHIDRMEGRSLMMNCEGCEWMLLWCAVRHSPSFCVEGFREATRSPTIAVIRAKNQTYDLPDMKGKERERERERERTCYPRRLIQFIFSWKHVGVMQLFPVNMSNLWCVDYHYIVCALPSTSYINAKSYISNNIRYTGVSLVFVHVLATWNFCSLLVFTAFHFHWQFRNTHFVHLRTSPLFFCFKPVSSCRFYRVLTMVYNTQNYWGFGLYPSSVFFFFL
jgi:hypothetical protein